MKKKMPLNQLEVKSFTTKVSPDQHVRGGDSGILGPCGFTYDINCDTNWYCSQFYCSDPGYCTTGCTTAC